MQLYATIVYLSERVHVPYLGFVDYALCVAKAENEAIARDKASLHFENLYKVCVIGSKACLTDMQDEEVYKQHGSIVL